MLLNIYQSENILCINIVESQDGQNFSPLHIIQTDPGAHPPGAFSPGIKSPGHEADHSPATSAEVKNMWICTSTHPYIFMAQYLISYAQGQLYHCRE
jgi:hypothetical protein